MSTTRARPVAESTEAAYMAGPPLFWRLLVANIVVVLGGAILGTSLTRLFVLSGRFTPLTHALMVLAAIFLSAALTAVILRLAFKPLRDLRQAIGEAERDGYATVSRPANLGRFGDPDIVAVARAVRDLWARLGEHVRLLEQKTTELEQKSAELERAAARVVAAQEEERRRLARELHDGTMQSVAALIMGLERGLQAMPEDVPHLKESHDAVERLRDVAAQTLEEVRQLALNLRPAVLDDHGLVDAARWLATTHEERTGTPVTLRLDGDFSSSEAGALRLPAETETALFRIAQEALANVAKHAGASRVVVRLERLASVATLTVSDDGVGFDPRVAPAGHMGLFSMRERAAILGGWCSVTRGPEDVGTVVRAEIPLDAPAPDETFPTATSPVQDRATESRPVPSGARPLVASA